MTYIERCGDAIQREIDRSARVHGDRVVVLAKKLFPDTCRAVALVIYNKIALTRFANAFHCAVWGLNFLSSAIILDSLRAKFPLTAYFGTAIKLWFLMVGCLFCKSYACRCLKTIRPARVGVVSPSA